MASNSCHYSLNTENCAVLSDLAHKICRSIQENDKVLARLTGLVDTKLRLPHLTKDAPLHECRPNFHEGGGGKKTPSGAESLEPPEARMQIMSGRRQPLICESLGTSENTENVQNPAEVKSQDAAERPAGPEGHIEAWPEGHIKAEDREASERMDASIHDGTDCNPGKESGEDSLRSHLDRNLRLDSVACDETRFAQVENARIRQLLMDNYRLLVIKEKKQAENKELFGIYNTYQRLLTDVIVPRLSQDTSAWNIGRMAAAKAACAENKFPLEDEVWSEYCKHIAQLEKMRVVLGKLMEILQDHVHDEQMEHLAMQVGIVERLLARLNVGELHQRRGAQSLLPT